MVATGKCVLHSAILQPVPTFRAQLFCGLCCQALPGNRNVNISTFRIKLGEPYREMRFHNLSQPEARAPVCVVLAARSLKSGGI
jgi:hypothetical protein